MKFLQPIVDFYTAISHFEHNLEVGDISRSFKDLQTLDQISIPFINQQINLFHAFKLLGKLFAFLDEKDDFLTVIYDYDKRLIIDSLLVNLGAGQSLIKDVITDPMPEDFNLEGDDSDVFQSVNKFLQNKYSIQIGRIKIFDIHLLENISREFTIVENQEQFVKNVIELILDGWKSHAFKVYPEIPFISTMEHLVSLFPNFSELLQNLPKIRGHKNLPVTFFDNEWYITFLQGKVKKSSVSISDPYEFGRITIKDHFRWIHFQTEFHHKYKKQHHAFPSYFIDIDWCIDFLSDVCESEFPLSKLRFEYILQRFLHFVKQNEEKWDVVPRPIIYNGYIRLLTRLCGFHINPRKLSYWSIPSNITHIIRTNFGSSGQIVILFTEKHETAGGLKIKWDKSSIQEILYLDTNDLKIDQVSQNDWYSHLTNLLGFIKTVIKIDKSVLSNIMKFLVIDRNSKNPLKFLSFLFLIRKLNNTNNFTCYPELPSYRVFKKMGAVRSFRKLNKLLYGFLEF